MILRALLLANSVGVILAATAVAQPVQSVQSVAGVEAFSYKSDADLAAMTLKPGVSPAVGVLSDHENYQAGVVVRTKDGVPELHIHQIDIMTIQHGEGWLTYGGIAESPRDIGNSEIRGSKIVGGATIDLHPGDYFRIPAGMWHQIGPKPGNTAFRYMFVKIRQ